MTDPFAAPDAAPIAEIRLTLVGVSAKSNWAFLEVELEDGRVGLGEATLHGYEPMLSACLDMLGPRLVGLRLDALPGALRPGRATLGGLASHAIVSAAEQARADLAGQIAGRPVAALVARVAGAPGDADVPVYANLNRSLVDRSPAAFAARAEAVLSEGFSMLKIAPFDGVEPGAADGQANEALVRTGLARVAAIREAAPTAAVLIDCHWRFDADRAARLLGELDPFGPYWVECPLPEVPARFADLARLRRDARARGTLLAGAETTIGLEGMVPYLELYDVVMPDVKYCGGPAEMLRIADAARARGVRVAPHNPSGPVCHAHSVHLAAHPAIDLLEMQHGESDIFARLTRPASPLPRDGVARVPDGPGLGLALIRAVCAAYPSAPVPPPR